MLQGASRKGGGAEFSSGDDSGCLGEDSLSDGEAEWEVKRRRSRSELKEVSQRRVEGKLS